MSRRTLVYLAGLGAAAVLSACSSSTTGGTSSSGSAISPAGHHVQTSIAPPTSSPATSAPASINRSATALSGSWSGRYTGAFHGTFTLTWHQSGGNLSGSIHLSDPADTLPLHGTVHGRVITFGTVGSLGITYSGTAAANSMSGHYAVQGGNQSAGGPWSATRT